MHAVRSPLIDKLRAGFSIQHPGCQMNLLESMQVYVLIVDAKEKAAHRPLFS